MKKENEEYKRVIEEIAKSVLYIVEQSNASQTKIYSGIILGESSGVYSVSLNGKTYTIPHYGDFSHSVNDVVKVFVPQNNMNLAFFI